MERAEARGVDETGPGPGASGAGRVEAPARDAAPPVHPGCIPFVSQGAATVNEIGGGRKETSVMLTPAASTANIVRLFTQEELEARRAAVVEELERRFGSLDRALEREEDWNYGDDEARLLSEYHAISFLLSD